MKSTVLNVEEIRMVNSIANAENAAVYFVVKVKTETTAATIAATAEMIDMNVLITYLFFSVCSLDAGVSTS